MSGRSINTLQNSTILLIFKTIINSPQNKYLRFFIFQKLTKWCHFTTYLWDNSRIIYDSVSDFQLSQHLQLISFIYVVLHVRQTDFGLYTQPGMPDMDGYKNIPQSDSYSTVYLLFELKVRLSSESMEWTTACNAIVPITETRLESIHCYSRSLHHAL